MVSKTARLCGTFGSGRTFGRAGTGVAAATLCAGLAMAPGAGAQAQPARGESSSPAQAPLPSSQTPLAQTPAPTGPTLLPGPNGDASAAVGISADATSAEMTATSGAPTTAEEDESAQRAWSLRLENGLNGSTGLLHLSDAGSGAPGTFRVSLLGSYFRGSEFLCNGSDCPPARSGRSQAPDEVRRTGAHLGISATLLPFLEAHFGVHSYATSNDQGSPALLQTLGDTNFGVKAFTPRRRDRLLSFGAQADLWLLNGTGSVGLDGGGTSVALRVLGALDLHNQSDPRKRIPLRILANAGYFFNNSGALVTSTEERQGRRITRIERFGLNVDRTDSVIAGLGVEGVFDRVRPFLEWTIDIPVNRQGYTCTPSLAQTAGDGCLRNESGFGTTPSRVTVGTRVYPWNPNLALLAAIDIGTGATYDFIEEVAPELPWNAYLGVAFAIDTKPRTVVQRVPAFRPLPAVQSGERYVLGRVVEKGPRAPIAGALVRVDGRSMTGFVSMTDGTFRTHDLEPGNYTLNVSAPGFRAAQCSALVPKAAELRPAYPPAPADSQTGDTPPPFGQAWLSPSGATVVSVECQLESLPKVGNVVGNVLDGDTNAALGGAKVKITDRLNRELELVADASGAFRFENVPPGPVKITVTANGYLPSVTELSIQPREDVRPRISVHKRPAQPNVVVAGAEVKLKKQVHFQSDSAEIMPDSQGILEELADVLKTRQEIKGVEVQGHTDNTGSAPYNLRLSQDRAEAVVKALEKLGVDRTRLAAKGYGQDKPLAPNTSEAGRAKNRRVQVMITRKE